MSSIEPTNPRVQAQRDEKPPAEQSPLFFQRPGPNGEMQRFYNRDPKYQLTVQCRREAPPPPRMTRDMMHIMQQQQQQAAGSYRGFGHDSTPNATYEASSSPYKAVAMAQASAGSYRDFGHDSTANATYEVSSSPYRAVDRSKGMQEPSYAPQARLEPKDYASKSSSRRQDGHGHDEKRSTSDEAPLYPDHWSPVRSRNSYPVSNAGSDPERISTREAARAEDENNGGKTSFLADRFFPSITDSERAE